MAQDNQVEFLHQQASALYLQGEYDAALEAWRQLLNLDPHDERAREGARLCELLVQSAGGSVAASRSPGPPAAAAPPTAVGFGMGEQLDQELSELDELLGGRPGRDWMDGPSAKAPAAREPAPNALEFDLGDVPARGATARGAAEFHFDVDAPDKPSQHTGGAFDLDADDTATREAGDTAAEELQRRSNELMAEALEYYERGERQEALSALSRLAILDEHNEAALTFASHIRSEMEQLGAPPDAPAFEDAADFGDPASGHDGLDFGLGETPQPPPAAPPVAARPPLAAAAPPPSSLGDELIDDPGFVAELSVSTVAAKGASSLPTTPARMRPNKGLILAASGLLLVGLLYVVYSALSGSSSSAGTETDGVASVAPLPEPPLPEEDAPAGETPAPEVSTAPTPGPLSPEARAHIDDVLNRADAEFESANFAAAVLSYNEALKLDPQNEVARKKLHEAGELFREQKAKLDEREAAFKSFEEGDYRNALRLFYRFEPKDTAEAQRLTRFKAIGWYNLGVRALLAGDCRLARSHLLESQQLDALDPHLGRAMELNAACFEGASGAYYESVRTLPLRGLEQ